MLKKRLRLISLVKNRNARYLKKTHKFGIEVPKSVSHAYALDDKNGKTLWTYTISKEMNGVIPAFRKLDNGEIVMIGYHRVNFHMVFDVKMGDFRRKAKLVAGGHMAEPPATITYESVFLRDTVRIYLTLYALTFF